MRQDILGLESLWRTRNGFFRFATGAFGICITDAWRIYTYPFRKQGSTNNKLNPDIRLFSHRVATSMINMNFCPIPGPPVRNTIGVSPPPINDVREDALRRDSVISDITGVAAESPVAGTMTTRGGGGSHRTHVIADDTSDVTGSVVSRCGPNDRTTYETETLGAVYRPAYPVGAPLLPSYWSIRYRLARIAQLPSEDRRPRKICCICGGKQVYVCVHCGAGCCQGGKGSKHCLFIHACEDYSASESVSCEWVEVFKDWLVLYKEHIVRGQQATGR